jgi:hypothetical protein
LLCIRRLWTGRTDASLHLVRCDNREFGVVFAAESACCPSSEGRESAPWSLAGRPGFRLPSWLPSWYAEPYVEEEMTL